MPSGGNFVGCGCGPDGGCQERTTALASTPLCREDGTPIAVVLTRDCEGNVTQDGWVNLVTAVYRAGLPPTDAAPCAGPHSGDVASPGDIDPTQPRPEYELARWCDLDESGEVIAPVLVEYHYEESGQLADVRTLTPNGEPYTVQGQLGVCQTGAPEESPGGEESPGPQPAVVDCEDGPALLVKLCDTGSPGEESPPELCRHCQTLVLCDMPEESAGESPGDVEPVQFLRTVCRGCDGEVVSTTDETLDGEPYTVTGTVGVCPPPPEPCRNTSTLLVCDLPTGDPSPVPTTTDTDPTEYSQIVSPEGAVPVPGGAAALWSGGSITIPPDQGPAPDGFPQLTRTIAATVQAPQPDCTSGTATVTASITVTREGPDAGCQGTGSFSLLHGSTQDDIAGVTPSNIPVGTTTTLEVSAQVPAADLAAGNVGLLGRLETYHYSSPDCDDGSGPNGARIGGWTVEDYTVEVTYDQTGCETQILATVVTDCETGEIISVSYADLEGNPYTPTGEIGQCVSAGGHQPGEEADVVDCEDGGRALLVKLCETSPGESPAESGLRVEPVLMCINSTETGQTVRPVIMEYVYDSTGERVETRVTDPETGEPVTVNDGEEVGHCGGQGCDCPSPGEMPCTDRVSTIPLCDYQDTSGAAGSATVTDTEPPPISSATAPLEGGAQPLWDGETFVFPADEDDSATGGAGEVYRAVAATLQADQPACSSDTATVTVSVTVANDGPGTAHGSTGSLRLWGAGDTSLATERTRNDFPAGQDQTLTLTAEVPAEDLAAGNVKVSLSLETWQVDAKSWTAQDFKTNYQYGTAGCTTEFLRETTVDCQTGEVAVEDRTLDGQPYTPSGTVGLCRSCCG